MQYFIAKKSTHIISIIIFYIFYYLWTELFCKSSVVTHSLFTAISFVTLYILYLLSILAANVFTAYLLFYDLINFDRSDKMISRFIFQFLFSIFLVSQVAHESILLIPYCMDKLL